MKPKYHSLIKYFVQRGVETGWEWAHKHDAHPPSRSIKEAISDHIMKEIAEHFDFDETII